MKTSFIKIVFLFFVLIIFFGFTDHEKEDRSGPPNIILIIVDDLGYSDLASYGNKCVHTPNIDALAKKECGLHKHMYHRRFADLHG